MFPTEEVVIARKIPTHRKRSVDNEIVDADEVDSLGTLSPSSIAVENVDADEPLSVPTKKSKTNTTEVASRIVTLVTAGDYKGLVALVESGANVNAQVCGNSALMYAAFYGRIDMVRFLLDSGAEPNTQNSNGATALHWAVKERKISIVQTLLDHVVDVNLMDKKGYTALHYAVKLANLKETLKVVELLTSAGADVNLTNTDESDCSSVLHEAASRGSVELCRHLMDSGADPNKQDKNNRTPLHKAAFKNNFAVVAELLNSGANPNALDGSGRTALHWACFFGFAQTVNALVQGRASQEIEDNSHETPLTIAKRRQSSLGKSKPNWIEILSLLSSE